MGRMDWLAWEECIDMGSMELQLLIKVENMSNG
jgi:hypothetical protein